MKKINIAVFISGYGSNLQSLIDAQGKTLLSGKIAFVLSSNKDAYGIIRAKNNNIPVACLNEKEVGKDVFYSTIEKQLRKYSIDLIVLAGYLPLLNSDFVQRWNKKIINIHPSLLPKYGGKGYYGLRVHQAVLDNKEEFTGATVHYVNEEIDGGEIIAQERIKVNAKSAKELQDLVLKNVEWRLLPTTVEKVSKHLIWNDRRNLTVAVLGSGGREHALVRKIYESTMVKRIICIPGNDGIIEAENINISLDDHGEILSALKKYKVDLCIVGPEKPLSKGIVDKIHAEDIACFGPSKEAALIESSKVFSKGLMSKYDIPTASYCVFNDYFVAKNHVNNCKYPIVVKADGLCSGKGVFVCENCEQANRALDLLMCEKIFNESGNSVIIEEKLNGIEISVMALTDGERYILLPTAKDYKKAHDGNNGPNTGGMGAIAPHPIWTEALQEECVNKILKPTLSALKNEGVVFIGCLYLGLMLTDSGLKVLEYNCRFGDPETQVVLPLIDQDIVPILFNIAKRELRNHSLKILNEYCCAVVLAASGYPWNPQLGLPLENVIQADVICSGIKLNGNCFVSNGGRVLCVIAKGKQSSEAIIEAYKKVECINFDCLFFRKDIGS